MFSQVVAVELSVPSYGLVWGLFFANLGSPSRAGVRPRPARLPLCMQLAAQLRQEALLAWSVPEIVEPCAPNGRALHMEAGPEAVRSLESIGIVEGAVPAELQWSPAGRRVCVGGRLKEARVHPALLVLVALVLVSLEIILAAPLLCGFVQTRRGFGQASHEVGGILLEQLSETDSRYAARTCKPTFGRSVSVNGSISNYSRYHSDKVHTCG